MIQWLNGNKTYLGTIALGILGILWSHEILNDQWASTLGSVVFAWTGVAVRHAFKKGK